MFLVKILIGFAVYVIGFVLLQQYRFYKNPVGKRAIVKATKIKVTIESSYVRGKYIVYDDKHHYGCLHISELKPIYFEL